MAGCASCSRRRPTRRRPMARDDVDPGDRLDRFLDAFARRPFGPVDEAVAVEPELAATVRWLRDHDNAPPADPAFADRLLEDLMDAPSRIDPFAGPWQAAAARRPGDAAPVAPRRRLPQAPLQRSLALAQL